MAFAFIVMTMLLGSSMMMAFVLDPSRKEPEAAVLGHRSVSIPNQNLCNNHTTILRAYVVFVSTAIYLYDVLIMFWECFKEIFLYRSEIRVSCVLMHVR